MTMRVGFEGRVLAAAVLALVAGAGGCSRDAARSQGADPAVQVLVNAADVVQVAARRLESGVPFTGELQPIQTVSITARFDGDLDRVLVREGERVQRGQALALYRPRDVRDKKQAADAQLQAAQANLLAAQNAERRARKLLDAGAVSPSDLEAAVAQRSAAEAQVQSAEALRNRAEDDSDRLDVPSPTAGWISKVVVHGGDRTAVGDRLMTVVKTDTLELSATVPSEALGRVQPGTPMSFRVDGFPGETFEGTVARVNPTTEPGTRQVRIYMRLPNPGGRLVGGLFATGRVIDSVKERAVSAPVAVLRKEGSEVAVYRVRAGRAQRIPVEVGLMDEAAGVVELVGDVGLGDSLLTGILPGLRDRATVRVLEGQESAAKPQEGGKGR